MIRSTLTGRIRIAVALSLSLAGGEAAVAVPHPISDGVETAQVASCIGAAQPVRSAAQQIEIRAARTIAVSANRHRLIIDARFTAYGASYDRRFSCTTDADGEVIEIHGRPLALR